MVRMQVRLSERQLATLRARARDERVSISELVRRAVEHWERSLDEPPMAERRRRAMAAAGRFASGAKDVSARHDEHLAELYRD